MEYLGISQGAWESIFTACRFVMVAIIVAYLVKVYIAREWIYIDLKADVLKNRLAAYKEINQLIAQIKTITPPPITRQAEYIDVVRHLKFCLDIDQGIAYSSMFDSKKSLCKFVGEVGELLRKHKLYLDAIVEDKLGEFHVWLLDVLRLYDGFCAAESDARWKLKPDEVERSQSFAAQTLGLIFQHDLNKFYRQINKLATNRIHKIRLGNTFGDRLFAIKMKWAAILDQKMDADTLAGAICRWVYYYLFYRTYGRSQLMRYPGSVGLALMNIHYRDEISSDKRDAMTPEKYMAHIEPFRKCMAQY